jgi:hypothetical protein
LLLVLFMADLAQRAASGSAANVSLGTEDSIVSTLDQGLAGLSPCDVQALKSCLEKNNNDGARCLKEIQAFQKACGKAEPGKK